MSVFASRLLHVLQHKMALFLCGALMFLCFAPFYQGWLCFFLLLPLIIACNDPNPVSRLKKGAIFSIAYFGVGIYWLIFTLHDQVHFSWTVALLLELILAAALGLAPLSFCWLSGYIRFSRFSSVLWLPAFWVFAEDIRFQAFGGGPWLSLGLSQLNSPLSGYFAVSGESGVSGMVVMISVLIVMAIEKMAKTSRWPVVPMSAILLILFSGIGLKNISWTHAVSSPISVAMVQSATSQQEKLQRINPFKRLHQLENISTPFLGKASLIIWPETVITLNKEAITTELQALNNKAIHNKTSFLIGTFEKGLHQKLFNSAFTLGYEGGQTYRKRHLVPFGEAVPPALAFLAPYVPGDLYRVTSRVAIPIAIQKQLMGITICWEGSFNRDVTPLAKNGATVIINVANEAWFNGTSLPQQNLDAMRIRAMESGRPVIRVANLGPSAVFTDKGEETASLNEEKPGAVLAYVQPMQGDTPFNRLGADFILILAIVVICTILTGNWFLRKKI